MSWSDYIRAYIENYTNPNTMQAATGVCEHGAMLGSDGTVWAATPGFALEKYSVEVSNGDGTSSTVNMDEFAHLAAAFGNGGVSTQHGGIRIHREKYYIVAYNSERRVMYLRKYGGGACVVKSNNGYVIGTFSTSRTMVDFDGQKIPQNPGATNRSVEALQAFLLENNL